MIRSRNRLLQPGVALLQQLRLKTKFLLISTAFLLPLGVTLYAVVNYANEGIDFAVSEQHGDAYLKAMNQLLPRAIASRGSSRAIDSVDLVALQNLTASDSDALGLKTAIDGLHDSASKPQEFVAQFMSLYAKVGDNSNLILDPDLDSFYTMTTVVDYGPKLMEAIGQLENRLAEAQTAGAATPESIATIRFLIAHISALQDSIADAVQRATKANLALDGQLDTAEWKRSIQALLAATEALQVESVISRDKQVSQVAATASDHSLQLMNNALVALDGLLTKRIDGFKGRRNFFLLLTLGSLLVTGYLICAFYVCDARGFEALITRMKKLATGDLTTNYPAQGSDEIGVLINSFNDSRASLQQMVHRIHHAADTISTAGHEIAAANMDLSQRGSTQSAVIGETFERVKEISEKIQTNLDGTGNANHIAEDAFTATQRGKTVVDSVVHTMDAMTGSSKRIGAIIGVINEIAFQTNLLALNAAVEAARAGEQGRGFAVVAGEVRNLAQRCATAANEITALIKNSVDEVNKGVSQVATAGKSMDEILAGVHSVSEIMGNMTRAGKTQADGIKVIESAVQKIDDDAQQNAALVEQTASAAELLRQQVAVLMESVGHFTLGGEQAVGFESPPVHTQSAAPDEISQAA